MSVSESTAPGLDMVDIRRRAFQSAFGSGVRVSDRTLASPDASRARWDAKMARWPEDLRLSFDVAVAARIEVMRGRSVTPEYLPWCERCIEARELQARFA